MKANYSLSNKLVLINNFAKYFSRGFHLSSDSFKVPSYYVKAIGVAKKNPCPKT